MRLADQIAVRPALLTKVKHGRGGAAIAHLVDQASQDDVVALTQTAVFIDQEFRHDKQRDPLGTGRCVGQLGQYQVDDVFAQFVVTGRDKDLVAADAVAAVFLRYGARFDVTQR